MSDLIERMQHHIQIWNQTDEDRAIFLTYYTMMTENMLMAIADGAFPDGPWVTGLTHCLRVITSMRGCSKPEFRGEDAAG